MAIERIDSIFDLAKIQGEIEILKKELTGLNNSIQNYKGVELKDLAANTEKLTTAMDAAATATTKVVQSNRAIIESAKSQSTAILGGADSYAFFANSVQETIRQQLKLNVQLTANKEKLKENEAAFKSGKITLDAYKDAQIELTESQKRMKIENQELNKSINIQIKQNSTVGGSLEDLRNQYNALYDIFKKLTDQERASDFGKQLSTDLGNLKANINDIQKSAGDFSANVGRYTGSFKEAFGVLESELIKVRQQLSTMNPESAGFDKLIKEEKALTQITEGLNKEFTNSAQEIKALQNAAITLGTELGNSNITFTSFKDAVGQGVDAVSDIRAQIKLAGSDTRALDGLIGVAQGLAGAYGAAQGAAALFGVENEDLQKTFVKLQAVMTVLQGLQEVRNALQTESAAMDAIMTVRTKALAAAQAVYTIAIGTSTGALRILRIAMAATGVGLLIAAIVLIAQKMDLFGDSTEDAAKALEDQKDAADRLIESLDKVATASEKARKAQAGGIDQTKRELNLLKARGASATDVFNKEQELRGKELSDLRVLALTYQGTYLTRKKTGQLTAADAEAIQAKINDINVQGLDKQNEIEAARLEFIKNKNKDANKEADKAAKITIEQAKSFDEQKRKAIEETDKIELEIFSETQSRIAEDEKRNLADRLLALNQFQEAKLAVMTIDADDEKHQLDVQRQEIINDYAKRIDDAKGNKSAIVKIKEQESKELASFDQFAAEEQKKIAAGLNQARINLAFDTAEKIKKIEFDLNADLKELYKDSENTFKESLDKKVQAYIDAGKNQSSVKSIEQTAGDGLDELGKKLQSFQTLSNNIFSAYGEIASIGIDKQKVAVEELEASQQKSYANEVDRINASAASDAEKADRLKILEAKRTAEKEANERKLRKLEIDRAKFEKAANIAGIISGTALAVVNALKTPPPLGPILAATVGILGAAQLARAIATPLPKYEKGTAHAKEGWAVTDEKGSELFIEPSGKTFLGSDAGPVTRYLKAGTKIIPANEVNQSLNNAMIRQTAMALQSADRNKRSELSEIKDAILSGTDATIRELKRNKKRTNITNIIDLGWNQSLRQKTFN